MALETNTVWIPSDELPVTGETNVHWLLGEELPPYVPQGDILVHPGRVSRLASLGGFEPTVTIDGDYQPVTKQPAQKRDRDDLPLSGITPGGAAVGARRLSLTRAAANPLTNSNVVGRSLERSLFPCIDRQPLRLSLNVPACQEKLAEQGNSHDANAWAGILDQEIRRGLRQAATRLLLTNGLPSTAVMQGSAGFFAEIAHWTEHTYWPTGYLILQGLPIAMSIASQFRKKPEEHYAFTHPQIDRLAATHVFSHLYTGRIVKPA